MTGRCTVCGENFKAWSDGEDMCGKCRVLVENERLQAEAERTCPQCGADMPLPRRKYCSESCRKKGERIKAGKAAVKTDSFAEYEKACVEAMKRGEWLTYGRFMAQKMTEGEAE